MNLPNKLTLLRIFLVLPFLALLIATTTNSTMTFGLENNKLNQKDWLFLSAGIIFVIAMFTDFLDGYLARKNKQITTFGKLFDPLADKFVTTCALVFFAIEGILPFYLGLGFILRDILVDGSRNVAAKNNVTIAASWIGKWKTFILSIGITIIFFTLPFVAWDRDLINPSYQIWLLIIPLLIALLLSTISGFKYFQNILPYLHSK